MAICREMGQDFVLVTGASGFVGRQLCPVLARAGYRVRALYRSRPPPEKRDLDIEWLKAVEIGPRSDWNQLLDGGISHVVHLAAVAHRTSRDDNIVAKEYDEVNHLGTARLAQAVTQTRSVRRFLFMSSIGAVTSLAAAPVSENTSCSPRTCYGRSKLAAEAAVKLILKDTPVEWCILRPPLIYGPGNPGNMARLLKLLDLSLPLPLGSVRNQRSFLYVGNLVDAIRVALEHPAAARKVFCLSDGEVISTPDLIRSLGIATRKPVRLFRFPLVLLHLIACAGSLGQRATGRSFGLDVPTWEKISRSLPVDGALFRNQCGWRPPYSLEQGLRATVPGP